MLQSVDSVSPIIGNAFEIKSIGMTKRELFAAMAMQGILSDKDTCDDMPFSMLADLAVKQADALIKALDQRT